MKQSKAAVQQRHRQILDNFNQSPSWRVSDLSKRVGVSEITIRRDLEALEAAGILIRHHGGARLADQVALQPEEKRADDGRLIQKAQIADIAADMVGDHSTLFINAGTTTLEVIRRVCRKSIRIITNNTLATSIVGEGPAELICTGGEYNPRTYSFIGELAMPLLNKVYASTCILGVNGISSAHGVTTHDYKETLINDLMLRRCNGKRIVVADGSKIGRSFCFTSTSFANIDLLITDASADAEELRGIEQAGVQIIIADQPQWPGLP